ncbi:MAG: hypothetical protein V2A53_04340 [bacterium]
MKSNEFQYDVLHPWAEVDPIPLRGISPGLPDMNNKTIGTFASTYKPASRPILNVVEEKLKARFPTVKFSRFDHGYIVSVAETKEKDKFEDWVKGVDAVVAAVGD